MCRQLIQEIRRSDRSIEAMPRCAELILDYFNIPENSQTPIIYIMKEMGIIAFRGQLQPQKLSAYIAVNPSYREKYGSDKIACVNITDNLGHQRFALAHELAHFLFDYDEVNHVTYYNTYYTEENYEVEHNDNELDIEYRANKFAAALLMPEKKFRKKYEEYYEKTKDLSKVVDELSLFFEVSKTAVTRRITEVI